MVGPESDDRKSRNEKDNGGSQEGFQMSGEKVFLTEYRGRRFEGRKMPGRGWREEHRTKREKK